MMGTAIVFTAAALKDSEERTFPLSRHRSHRVHKKLVKRFGGEFKRVPAMWWIGGKIYAHPSFREAIRRATIESDMRHYMERMQVNALLGRTVP